MAGSNEIILKKKQKKHSINQWSCYHLGATRRCVEENERQTNKQTKNKWKLGKKASKKWKLKLGRVRNRFARYLVSVLVGFYHQTLRCHSVIFNRSFFFLQVHFKQNHKNDNSGGGILVRTLRWTSVSLSID